jgi:hypothetical protein
VRARVAASAGLVAIAAIALAGCNFITPQATLQHYEPSDGLSARVGDVEVLNAMVLSEDGESGNLLFSALNTSEDDIELTIQYEGDDGKVDLQVDLEAQQLTEVGFGDDGQLFLEAIGTRPGGLLPVYFQYGDKPGRQLLLPVLDGVLEQYEQYVPTPTPTPTDTPMPIETGIATTPSPTPAP